MFIRYYLKNGLTLSLITLIILLCITDKAYALVINTHKMTVFYEKNMALLEGKVQVTYNDVILQANKAVIKYNHDNKTLEQIEAIGDVSIKNNEIDAKGENAIYNHDTAIVKLSGNVIAHNKEGDIQGEVLIYNLNSRKAVIDSKTGASVRLQINNN